MEIDSHFILRFIIWFLVSSVWVVLTIFSIWKWWSVEQWRTTIGKILASSIESRKGEDGATIYSANVRYGYRVAGKDYESSNIVLFAESGSDKSSAQKIVARYPKDASVTVYYNPKNQRDSLLEMRIQFFPMFFLLMYGGVVVFLTLLLLNYV